MVPGIVPDVKAAEAHYATTGAAARAAGATVTRTMPKLALEAGAFCSEAGSTRSILRHHRAWRLPREGSRR